MTRTTIVSIAVISGLAVAAGMKFWLIPHARRAAVDNERREILRDIGATLQTYVDTLGPSDRRRSSLLDRFRTESPSLLSPHILGDGTIVSYEMVIPNESLRGVDPSKVMVVRELMDGDEHPSAALFADGHVVLER